MAIFPGTAADIGDKRQMAQVINDDNKQSETLYPSIKAVVDYLTQFIPESAVLSVNGQTGEVVLSAGDVGALPAGTLYGRALSGTSAANIYQIKLVSQTGTTLGYIDVPAATQSRGGIMTATDKTKLDGIEAGAEVNKVDAVNGQTGFVIIDRSDIGAASETEVEGIKNVIPSEATAQNKLADKDFVNSSLNSITAFYITRNAAGQPFESYAQLSGAQAYYSGGEVRTPTRNDYCVVLEDETRIKYLEHIGYTAFTEAADYIGFYILISDVYTAVTPDNYTTLSITPGTTVAYDGIKPTVRYIYQGVYGEGGQWEFQFVVNETALTAAQLAALNSGVTSNNFANSIQIVQNNADWVTINIKDQNGNVISHADIQSVMAGSGLNLAGLMRPSDKETLNNVVAALPGKANIGRFETLTVLTSDWSALSSSEPYTVSATVSLATAAGVNDTIELINDNAVLFAKYGFAIGEVNLPYVTFYATEKPDSAVTLKVDVKNEVIQ